MNLMKIQIEKSKLTYYAMKRKKIGIELNF